MTGTYSGTLAVFCLPVGESGQKQLGNLFLIPIMPESGGTEI